MCAFSYMWSLPVVWQRWQSQYLIHHSQKPHAVCKLHGSMFYRIGVIADLGISSIFAPVTLTLTPSPLYTKLTPITSSYTGCVKMNFLRQVFRKWSYCRHTYRQMDRQTYICQRNYISCHFASGHKLRVVLTFCMFHVGLCCWSSRHCNDI